MTDFILTMGSGYLQNSGLHFMGIDPAKISLEIQEIWATDSEENDYNPCHSHFGLMSGVFYLKTPEKSGNINFINPNQRITSKFDHTFLKAAMISSISS